MFVMEMLRGVWDGRGRVGGGWQEGEREGVGSRNAAWVCPTREASIMWISVSFVCFLVNDVNALPVGFELEKARSLLSVKLKRLAVQNTAGNIGAHK